MKMRLEFRQRIIRPLAQILVYPIGLYDLARLHLPFRIPNRFEFAKCLQDFLAVHMSQQLTASLAITMFAGERPAITDDEVCGLLQKLPEALNSGGGFKIEGDPGMDTALTEVSIQRPFIVELIHQLFEISQIEAEFL